MNKEPELEPFSLIECPPDLVTGLAASPLPQVRSHTGHAVVLCTSDQGKAQRPTY